jgi:hypothetical protein
MAKHPEAIDKPIAKSTIIVPEVEGDAQVSTAPEPATEKPSEIKTPDTSEKPAEEPSQWWLWLIGAMVVIGGLGLVLRRKS